MDESSLLKILNNDIMKFTVKDQTRSINWNINWTRNNNSQFTGIAEAISLSQSTQTNNNNNWLKPESKPD